MRHTFPYFHIILCTTSSIRLHTYGLQNHKLKKKLSFKMVFRDQDISYSALGYYIKNDIA